MASKAQYDLEKEITQWREGLWQSGKFSSDELDELEDHVREELTSENFKALSDEQKFVLAQHKIGSDATLEQAYGKNRLAGFLKISWLAQCLICFVSFLLMTRIAAFALADIDSLLALDSYYAELTIYLSMQLLCAWAAFALLRKMLRLSKTESQLPKANALAIISMLTVFLAYNAYAYISPYGRVLGGPLVINVVTYLLYLTLFIAFIIANFRARKRLRLSHS